MTVSVLTLVKDRQAQLGNLVEGLNRSKTAPMELIIVDMSDEPVAFVGAHVFTILLTLPGEGLPLAKARNLAAHHATSDYLLFLDVDCIPSRDLISRMARALRDEDAIVCAEILYLAADDVEPTWTHEELTQRGQPHPARPFVKDGLTVEHNAGLFWSLAFGIRKTTFAALGGFDEGFVGYGAEDTDFGFRARDAGLPLLFMGGAGAFHQHHDVFHPPLQHFTDIVRNATKFHGRWKVWPMEGWLTDFESMGLIERSSAKMTVLQTPTRKQINDARSSRDRF